MPQTFVKSPQTKIPPPSCGSQKQHPGLTVTDVLLVGILLLAVLLRLGLLQYGLPLLLYEDEPLYYQHALGFGLGDWVIPYFRKPPFFLYFYGAFYYLGFLYSPFMHWKDYAEAFWQDPSYVAAIGRTVSVAFAAGSVWLLAQIGRRAFSVGVGLAAAFLLAFDPTHLRISPVVISDIPSLFFILAGAWFALSIAEKGRLRDYLLCALMVTLAMSFKYNVFSVFFLVSGHLARYREQGILTTAFWRDALSDRRFWLAVGLIPVAYLALNPMILMDFQTFWHDLNWEKRHMLNRNPQSSTQHWQIMASAGTILFKILPKALSWPLYILSLLAIPWMFRRHPQRAVILFSFPLVFLLVVMQFRLINAKYLLPVFPFLFLGTAVLLRDVVRIVLESRGLQFLARWQPAAYTALVLLSAIPAISATTEHVRIHVNPDTRNTATHYLQKLTMPNDRLLLEPETVTLDNRITRASVVIANYDGKRFHSTPRIVNEMATLNPETIHPRYVLMDFSEMESRKDAQGHTYYELPHANPTYYRVLRQQYHFKAIFAPYSIYLPEDAMARELATNGFESLYARIQNNKTTRQSPGPLLLLLEQN
jgi:4-amino-4-deoxy-L-arabinose transferase-like glycosyltransferase